jgi:nitrate reductase cytochrome c-type subunit
MKPLNGFLFCHVWEEGHKGSARNISEAHFLLSKMYARIGYR